jgi:Tol biopolymer transport system component
MAQLPSTRVLVRAALSLGALVIAGAIVGALIARDDGAQVRGDLIAYSCKEPGNRWYAICLMNADGSEQRRVTSRLATTDPAWSPDGRRIAFTRNEDVGESTTFTDDDVFVMDADASDVRQLTPEVDGQMSGQPSWSPDGEHIVFMRGQSVHSAVPSRFGALFVMRADRSDVRRLTSGPDSAPAWSPDGREIAFSHGENLSSFARANEDIYVVDRGGGEPRRLTRTTRFFETTPAWSPDGSRIVFARSTFQTQFDGKEALYVMSRNGGEERLLLVHRHFAGGPQGLAWSPDGRTIAFETSPVRDCTAIHLLDVASGRSTPLTSCTRKRDSTLAPSWQPVGR